MKRLLVALIVTSAFSTMALASDMALYVGPPNPGWYTAAAVATDADTIINMTGHLFKDVQKFDDKQLADFTAWIEANMNDGEMDIIWLNGTMPSNLYQFPNTNPNGSRAELWLDGGNMFINVGDWFAYTSYEGGVRSADNGGTGAANILDLAAGVIVSADNTALQVTDAGRQYLPSITSPVDSDRPIAPSAVVAPWEVAAVFAQNADGSRADPVVIHNTLTGAYVAFINQANPGFPNRGLTTAEFLLNWVNAVIGLSNPSLAANPVPDDETLDVPQDIALSWTAGEYAATHDVYFGASFADVNDATRSDPKGVLAGQGQTAAEFDPDGLLEFGQTYYWRIDEVNAAPDNTIFKGQVWSFTVEPFAYPVTTPITATASSAQPGMVAQNVVNGSGLNADGQHSVEPATMWTSAGGAPNWIQFEFTKVYKLHEMWVWNSNQLIETFLGFGAKNVTIEYSTDGQTWKQLEGVPEFAKATAAATYTANTTVSFQGVEARFVKLTINANWGGMAPQTGLSEVRFFYVPVQAFEPKPAVGATGVSVGTDLTWRPGREAKSHKVYLGTDEAAVAAGSAAAQTVTDHSYTPAALAFGTKYFWKVEEVGDAGAYAGDVWSFTTEEFASIENFESYNDNDNRIYEAWIDGLTDGKNGSQVGYNESPFAEKTIVHGGAQSMPLMYDNTSFAFSEAKRTFASQDWTVRSIKSLSLWFRGAAGNTGQLYVKVNDTKVLYDGDAADLARTAWQVWNIDLSKAGNVKSVKSLTIGIEGAGAKGTLYVDDVRLYPKTPEYVIPAAPQAANLVAHYTFDEGSGTRVGDSSGKGNHGTANGNPQWVAAGFAKGAMAFDGVDDYVDCGNNASVTNVESVSVSVWVKVGVVARDHKIASNQNNATGGYKLGVYSGNSMVEFEVRTAANAATLNRAAPGGTPLQVDTWYHVVGVYEKGKAIRTYVNGRLDRELLTTVVAGISNGALMLGREAPAGAYWWQGQMDDLRVYNQALSDAEVAGLAGQTKPIHKPF